jgi:cell division protein FtsB
MQWPLHGKAADELRRLHAENEALRQLTSDLLSALEYHEEQTRPIHSTTVAIEAARAALARAGEVK